MRWKVLISAPYAMPVINVYRKRLEAENCDSIVAEVNERLEEHELLPIVNDVDGIICGDDRITARVIEAAPRLKVISKWGTGIDSIDVEAAARSHSACVFWVMTLCKYRRNSCTVRASKWSRSLPSSSRPTSLQLIRLSIPHHFIFSMMGRFSK